MNRAKNAPSPANLTLNLGLTSRNTFGVNAHAERAYEITSADQIPALMQEISQNQWEWRVLGGGSNVILPPTLPGATLLMNIGGQTITHSDSQNIYLEVGAGVNWHEFVKWSLDQNMPGLENLALIGALDSLTGEGFTATRGDILARVRQLNAIKNRPLGDSMQPTLDFTLLEQLPSGNPEMTTAEKVGHEMSIMKMDVSEHVLEMYRPMLDEMGVLRADELVGLRSKTEVLVAGVRVATQTPPMRSGKRVVFVTLDDGTGCSDSTFFDEAQSRCSHILFNTRLVLIAGKTRRTGVRGVSIMAENAWDIRELWQQWQQKTQAAG